MPTTAQVRKTCLWWLVGRGGGRGEGNAGQARSRRYYRALLRQAGMMGGKASPRQLRMSRAGSLGRNPSSRNTTSVVPLCRTGTATPTPRQRAPSRPMEAFRRQGAGVGAGGGGGEAWSRCLLLLRLGPPPP